MDVRTLETKFKNILLAASPSGIERGALEEWKNWFADKALYYTDKMGNIAYAMGQGPTKILISGHIDEVQARVSTISKDGIITMISTGGIDKKALIASHVKIMSDRGTLVDAIVQKKPIHLEEDGEYNKVQDIHKMKLDVGASSRDEVEAMGIHVGSTVIYDRNTNMNFGENRICSQGLDDKVGVFISYCIYRALMSETDNHEFVPDWMKEYTIIFLAAVQEETGCRGAQVASHNINPDISIDFDVTFATDGGLGIDITEFGECELGKGAVIQYGPDKSERLNNIFVNVAKDNKFPFQRCVHRAGGTNTNQIQLRSKDCETTLVSIPNRNMHTPIEVCDWRDIQSIVDIVSNAIANKLI